MVVSQTIREVIAILLDKLLRGFGYAFIVAVVGLCALSAAYMFVFVIGVTCVMLYYAAALLNLHV